MLAVQEWLQNNSGGFTRLKHEFGIEPTFHEYDSRVILNYNQLSSPKLNLIVKECRGLVLDRYNYDLIARAFPRFFNTGECLDLHSKFNWENCTSSEKVDGSLILTYMYQGVPHLNTRASFGGGTVGQSELSWRELFSEAQPNWREVQSANSDLTLVWELCSRENQVVRYYPKPIAYFLSAFSGECELTIDEYDTIANYWILNTPTQFKFHSQSAITQFLEATAKFEPTFEGIVVRDNSNLRMKVKSKSYLELHRTVNNHKLTTERIVAIILSMGADEFLTYYPDYTDLVRPIELKIEELRQNINEMWPQVINIANQKEFALAINHLPYKAVLFSARRDNGHPTDYLNTQTLVNLLNKD